jgi:hypothetical protein
MINIILFHINRTTYTMYTPQKKKNPDLQALPEMPEPIRLQHNFNLWLLLGVVVGVLLVALIIVSSDVRLTVPANAIAAQTTLGIIALLVAVSMTVFITALVTPIVERRARTLKADSNWIVFGPEGAYDGVEGFRLISKNYTASTYLDQISFKAVTTTKNGI